MTAPPISSGVPSLDQSLGGFIAGDNVVWIAEADAAQLAFEDSFLEHAVSNGLPSLFVATTVTGRERALPSGVERIDATVTSPLAPAPRLADELERRIRTTWSTCLVVEDLAAPARRWGTEEAVAFFARACPTMLHAGTVTYWRVPRRIGSGAIERLRRITQWLLERRGDQLHVIKCESRTPGTQGLVHDLSFSERGLTVQRHPSAGRLARGLASIRRDLGLTQAQLAEIAGVTPSAISQAESGARGLSVDTLIMISDRLSVSLDRLVNASPDPGYRLSRHDRPRSVDSTGLVALADDVAVGLRANMVVLGSGEHRTAPLAHDGVQLITVSRGLIQVDVGDDTPVLRAGDSLLSQSGGIRSWKNLRPEPASFLWVLRD